MKTTPTLLRRIILILPAFLLLVGLKSPQAQPVDVSLSLNMNFAILTGQFNPASDFVDVAGNFNAWAGTLLSDANADGIYEVIASGFSVGSQAEFKFRINGNWNTSEFPGGGPNRTYTPVAGPNNLNFYYSFLNPVSQVLFTIVDGTQAHDDIELKGTMSNWALIQMYDDGTNGDVLAGDHTWSVEIPVGQGNWEWGAIQNDGSTNGIWLISGPNQLFSVSATGTVSGQTNYAIPPPGNIPLTLSVNMNLQMAIGAFDPATDFVDVAGGMTNWNGVVMQDPEMDGIYTVTIPNLTLGATYQFKFRINGDWNLAEFPGGGPNREITIITGTNIASYWFNDQELGLPVDVSFTITDLPGTLLDVELKGSFNAWTQVQMFDDGTNGDLIAGDHIWTLVTSVPAGTWQWGAVENDGSPYGIWLINGPDLNITVSPTGDVTGPTNYTIPLPITYNQVFTVTDGSLGYTNIQMKGSFNNWTLIQMYDNGTNGDVAAGDHVWTAVATVTPGSWEWGAIENDGSPEGIYLIIGANPAFTMASDGSVTGQVDYIIPSPNLEDVTFNVNMNHQITLGNFNPSTQVVDIAGSFNSFSGTIMEDLDGDGIYTTSIAELQVGATYDFKFRINADWNLAEFPGGGPNRQYTVVEGSNLLTFWFNNQEPSPIVYEDLILQVNMNHQITLGNFDPLTDFVDVAGTLNAWAGSIMDDPDSDGIYTVTIPALIVGTPYEFKFRINADWNLAEFPGGGPNRQYTLVEGDNLLSFWFNDQEPDPIVLYTHDLSLNMGWNLISTYIIPEDASIAEIMSPILPFIRIVKNGTGQIFWPQFNINSIINMILGQGYQANLISAQTLSITGQKAIPEATPLSLPQGWNMIGYLRSTSGPILQMLTSISGQFNIVKNGLGQVYWPTFGINSIVNMNPGFGYQISMISAGVLTYPANIVMNQKTGSTSSSPITSPVTITDNNLSLCLPAEILPSSFRTGDELVARDASGRVVGHIVLGDGNQAISIWGDDNLSEDKDGLQPAETFSLQQITSSGLIQDWEVMVQGNQTPRYAPNSLLIATRLLPVQSEKSSLSLYPNPANDVAVLEFFSPSDQVIHASLCNSLGQSIKNFPPENVTEGKNSIQIPMFIFPEGNYFLRVQSREGQQQIRVQILR